jgi:hypothetical protein
MGGLESTLNSSNTTANITPTSCVNKPSPYCALAEIAGQLATTTGFDDTALSQVDAPKLQSVIDTHGEYTWQPPNITTSSAECTATSTWLKDGCQLPTYNQKRVHVGCFKDDSGLFGKRIQNTASTEQCHINMINAKESFPYIGMRNGTSCFIGARTDGVNFSNEGLSTTCQNGTGGINGTDVYAIVPNGTGNGYGRIYENTNNNKLLGKNVVMDSGIYSWDEFVDRSPNNTVGAIALGPNTKMTIWEIKPRVVTNPCNCSELILPDTTVSPDITVGISFE